MCCRYWTRELPEIDSVVEEMNHSPLAQKWRQTTEIKTYGEMRPRDVVPVLAPDRAGERAVFPMRWGYSAPRLLMNARTETAAVKPTFRDGWERRRCVVPAAGYFEWEHLLQADGKKRTGTKYAIRPKDASVTWLCGLYRIEEGLPHFVILTREPGESIRFIHDRMPLILPGDQVNAWLNPASKAEDLLPYALTDMVFDAAADKWSGD